MRGRGRFEFDAAFFFAVEEPMQDALVLICRDHLLFSDRQTASHRYQQEGVQGGSAKPNRQIVDLLKLMFIATRDGSVDLYGDALFLKLFHAADGCVESAGNPAESVVRGCVGAIQADRYADDTCF